MKQVPSSLWQRLGGAAIALIALLTLPSLAGAATDIDNAPLVTTTAAQAKPNVMLLMDASDSMGRTHMPDEVESVTGPTSIGYKNAKCNVLYYDPNKIYAVPKDENGADFPTPSFTSAPYTGFVAKLLSPTALESSNTDLSQYFVAYDPRTLEVPRNYVDGSGAANPSPYVPSGGHYPGVPAYYYVYTPPGVGPADSLSYSSAACGMSDPGTSYSGAIATPNGGTWTRVTVSATSGSATVGADERTNFAIWYSFYRTRLSLIKSAAALAFTPLGNTYRVGFLTVEPKSSPSVQNVDPLRYLPMADFDASNRVTWFKKLFSQTPGGASPAREGLARVGRYYAGMSDKINSNMITGNLVNGILDDDPVKYACQQNFTIMTTDGYWNAHHETTGIGGPLQLDGASWVGQQDGPSTCTFLDPQCARPIYDGVSSSTEVDTTAVSTYLTSPCATGGFLQTVQHSTATVNRYSKNSVATQQRTVSYWLSSQQTTAQTAVTSRYDTQNTQTKTRLLNEEQRVVLVSYTDQQTVTHTQITTQQYWRSAAQIVARSFRTHELVKNYTQTVNQWQQSSQQYVESRSQWQEDTSQYRYGAVQWLRLTYQVNTLGEGENYNVPTAERCVVSGTSLQGTTTPSGLQCADVVSYGGGGPASNPAGDGNSTTFRYDNSGTCAALVAGGTGTWNGSTYSVVDSNSPYIHTDCKAGPDNVAYGPVTSCPYPTAPGTVGNSWRTSTCDHPTTGPTPVSSCTYGPGSHTDSVTKVVTTCNHTVNTSGPVAACTYGTSPYVEGDLTVVTCSQPGATNYAMRPSPACSPADGMPHTDGSQITTVCTHPINNVTSTVPSCASNPGSSGNGYQVVTCSPQNTVSDTIVSSSQCAADSAANGGLTADGTGTITCYQEPYGPDAAGNVPEPSCPANGGGVEYVCSAGPLNQPVATPVSAGSCPDGNGVQSGGGSYPYVTYTCSLPGGANNTPAVPPTYIDPALCHAGTNGSYVTTTCTDVPVSGPTDVDPATCPLGTTTVGTDANHYVTTCTKHFTSGPTPIDPNSCMHIDPTVDNGWTTTDCETTYINVTAVPWGSCTSGTVVTHLGPGDDIICTQDLTNVSHVVTCTDTGAGDDNTAAHWHVSCSGPVPVPSPIAPPTFTPITGAHNVDSATCVDGSVWGDNIVAHCSTTSTGTPYPTATGVADCHPGFDANGTYGPAGLTWTCAQPGGTNFTSHQVASSDPTCQASTSGAPQTGPDQTVTTCTKTDDNGMVGGNPNYVSAAACNAAITAQPMSEITCSPVPLNDVPADPATCVAGTTSATYPYDYITSCSGPTPVPPVTLGACTPINTPAYPSYQTRTCGLTVPVSTTESSCTPTYSSPGVPGIDPGTGDLITCTANASGVKYDVSTTTTVTTINTVNGVVGTPAVVPTTVVTPGDGVCHASAAEFPALVQPTCSPASPCRVVTVLPGGSTNSLADVAQYYYETDLRPAGNPSPVHSDGSVRTSGTGVEADTATYVHMTTFVVGLGVSGTLNYDQNYKAGLGDFGGLRSGAKTWPIWPDPTAGAHDANGNYYNPLLWNNPKSIDDYWHTAVNGRGTFFSATDPGSVVLGLGTALSTVQATSGAGAADAVSSPQPTVGNNFAFSTGYTTTLWTGDLRSYVIDLSTGAVGSTMQWSASDKLNSLVGDQCDNRNIYLLDQANPARIDNLVDFTWDTWHCNSSGTRSTAWADKLTTASEQSAFDKPTKIAIMSQYFGMTAAQKAAATSPALVNYLRGQRGDEITASSSTKLFRARAGVLGDIVDSQPVYVQKPFANYLDTGYSDFVTNNSTRPAMVYVGGNDGMLHAFNAVVNPAPPAPPIDTQAGMEKWAIVPSTVLSNMSQLADAAYISPANHRFFVDGTPVAGDIDAGSGDWHTILVGGLNAGGKGYYAIDITDPTQARPKALWEFKQDAAQCPSPALGPYLPGITGDCHLGLTFGKPLITKLAGRWVVLFSSGYNNDDGGGYVYVVDAYTGNLIQKIATGVGSSSNPSGLAQLNNYVSNALVDNTTVRAYGGDLLGNVWRFDFAGAGSAQLIGVVEDDGNTPQPITTRPELAELNGKPMVFIGTGQFLGTSDVDNVNQQSVYGIVDPLTTTGGAAVYAPHLRSSLNRLKMTQIGAGAGAKRTVACASAGTCVNNGGWVVDFPSAVDAPTERGERVNVDMKLVLGTLVVASNVPTADVCTVGGHSWYNYFNFSDGQAVSGADLSNVGDPTSARIVSQYLSDSLIVGFNVVQLPPPPGSSNPRFVTEIHTSDGREYAPRLPVSPPPFQGKRISWREIVQP